MVNIARPTTAAPTYVKVANFPGLYRHSRSSGRYYACKKLGGIRRESQSWHLRPENRRTQAQRMGWQLGQGGCRGGENHALASVDSVAYLVVTGEA